jgi:hypothetical protein
MTRLRHLFLVTGLLGSLGAVGLLSATPTQSLETKPVPNSESPEQVKPHRATTRTRVSLSDPYYSFSRSARTSGPSR